MAATKQTQAVAIANELISLAAQLQQINFTAQSLSQRYSNQGIQAVLNALPTTALNSDGTPGLADSAPNNNNPINTALVSGLNRAVPASDLISAKNVMNDFIAFLGNGAVTTSDRNNKIDKLTGG